MPPSAAPWYLGLPASFSTCPYQYSQQREAFQSVPSSGAEKSLAAPPQLVKVWQPSAAAGPPLCCAPHSPSGERGTLVSRCPSSSAPIGQPWRPADPAKRNKAR
eukprot:246963-Pyramimonas_sp.AAC.1